MEGHVSDQTVSTGNDAALELLKNTTFFKKPDGPAAVVEVIPIDSGSANLP
jgi:hypothetical protein